MIITNNEEALRVFCEPVKEEEIAGLVSELEKELNYSAILGRPGCGLAASQIGIAKDIAIVRHKDHNFTLVNSKIINQYDPFIFMEEGCLSFPGRVENTRRFNQVVIDNNGSKLIAEGMVAVIIQHELDHLNKKLFMDYSINKNKLGPNDPCFCGKIDINTNKIKKYKKCCGR